jgi:hypothetical protein
MTGAILIGSLLVIGALWLAVEWKTLADDVPGNHITAVVRRAVAAQPGPFILFALALGFLFGHLFWP